MSKGLLIVYTGPSGVGKGTIMKELLKANSNLRLSCSATTRAPREGEVDGKDYYFVSREKFDEMIENDEFLEYAEYVGNKYGTVKKDVTDLLEQGYDVLLEIEVQGFKQIKNIYPDCLSIFILPPSREELLDRLRTRGTESNEDVEARIKKAEYELSQAKHFDHKVINEDVRDSTFEILSIINDAKEGEIR